MLEANGHVVSTAGDGEDGVRQFEQMTFDLVVCDLFMPTEEKGTETLAKGFKGPADFCVVPEANGFLGVVPDLVQGELRLVHLVR